MATFTERLELLITATSKNAVSELEKTGTATENLTGKQKLLGGITQTAENYLGQFGVTAEQTGAALGVAAGAAGALAAVKVGEFAYGAAQDFSTLTGEVRGFQRVAGTSAEDSSKLVFAVKELGIEPDAAASAFGRFATRLGDNKTHLDEYGVAVAHNKDGTVDLAGTVANLSDAYQNIKDPTQRAALANDAFGRSWQTLAPLLGKGKEQLAEIYAFAATTHQIFDPAQLEAGRQFTVATEQLHSALTGLKIELGSAVAPVFTEFTKGLTDGITTADSLASHVGGLGGIVKTAVDASPVGNFSLAMQGASDIAKGDFASGIGEAALSVVPFGKNIADVTGLFDSGSDSTQNYTDKQKSLQDAQKKVADLLAEGKTNTQEYKDAVKAATDQSDSFDQTNKNLALSLQSVTDKEFAAIQQHLALAGANLTVESGVLNVHQALKDQAQAQHDANDAAQVGIDNSAQVEGAHIKVQNAILGVVKAAQDRAVQALGPGASSEEVYNAKIKATNDSLDYMAATGGPEAVKALQDLGYQVLILPGTKEVVVTANTTDAEQKIAALQQQVSNFLGFATQAGAYTGGLARTDPTVGVRSLSAGPGALSVSAQDAGPEALSASPTDFGIETYFAPTTGSTITLAPPPVSVVPTDGARVGPALVINEAHFHEEVDLELLMRQVAWAARTRAV